MQKFKIMKVKAAMAILLVLVMAMGMFMPAYAAQINFPTDPLRTISGVLVADGNTRYYAEIEQNETSKLITATIKVANEGTSQITIGGVCVELSYSAAVAPYRYISLTGPHPFDASRLYLNPGAPNTTIKPVASDPNQRCFMDYCWMEDVFSAGSTAFCNNASTDAQQGRFIGGKVTVVDESDMIKINAGAEKVICKLFFMPVNGTDQLKLDMFKFEHKSTIQLIVMSPYIINGTRYLLHKTGIVSSTNTFAIYPQAFKLHVLRPKPENLIANQTARSVDNYINAEMEWSYDAAGPYSSGTPVVKDEPHTIYVRNSGTDYISDNVEFGNYKRAIPSDPVALVFGKNFIPIGPGNAVVTKTSENLTSTDNKNHVLDRIRYTVVAENKGHALSVWASAVMTDTLPDGVVFAGNVRLGGTLLSTPGGYTFTGGVLTVPLGDIPGGTSKTVTFEVTIAEDAYGKDITNAATVTGKDGDDTGDIIIDDDEDDDDDNVVVARSAAPGINPITEGDMTITGTGVSGATVTVTLPDNTVLTAVPVVGGVWTVTVPAGKNLVAGNVVKAVQKEPNKDLSAEASTTVVARPDPVKYSKKTAEDITTTDQYRHVDDILIYTIEVGNTGDAKSIWRNATIIDELPPEVDFLGLSTVMIDGSPAGLAATYGSSSHTLTIALGDIPGGVTKIVTFRVKINEKAFDNPTFKNVAKVDGTPLEEGPEPPEVLRPSRQPDVDEVNEGDRVITGTGIPNSDIEISFPNSTLKGTGKVGADGKWSVPVPGSIALEEGDEIKAVQIEPGYHPSAPKSVIVQGKKPVIPFMRKTSENTSTPDGKTRPGDVIKYTVEIGNSGSPKSFWTGGVMTDIIPDGVTLRIDTIRIDSYSPTFTAYDNATRKLEVSLHRAYMTVDNGIQGGTSLKITFDCWVDPDAHGKHVVNSASVEGYAYGEEDKPVNDDTVEEGGGFTVVGKSEKPDVDDITRGDSEVTGEGIPGATITVRPADGGPPVTTTVDGNGKWKADITGREPDTGDIIVVTQTEPGKDASDPVNKPVLDKTFRVLHGYVYPIADYDWEIGDHFLRLHDVVIELRPTYQSAAVASSTANLIPDTSLHPALAPFITAFGDGNLGEFTIDAPFGNYLLVIKREGYLVRCLPVTISASTPDLFELVIPDTDPFDKGVFKLWWGDCNDDFRIDNADIMAIIELMEYGVNAYSPYYYPACDMNADGRCDNADIMMVIEYWNKYANEYAGAGSVRFDI